MSDMDSSHIPAGFSSVTPFVAVVGAADALVFYSEVFGATVTSRMDGPDGTVVHAELDLGAGRLQLGDPSPDFSLTAPTLDSDDTTYSLAIYVPDVDATFRSAVEHGARVREEPADFVTGDRFASVKDPFGVRWTIMTRMEQVSDEEAQRRLDDWAASMS